MHIKRFGTVALLLVAVVISSAAQAQAYDSHAGSQAPALPSRVSLYDDYMRYNLPAQEQIGDTCWAYCTIGALELELSRAQGTGIQLSGRYLCWGADQADKVAPDHQGSNFGRATRALEQFGICPLSLCPQRGHAIDQQTVAAALDLGKGIVTDWIRFWKRNRPGETIREEEFVAVKQHLANGHPVAIGLLWPKRLQVSAPDNLIRECEYDDVQDGHGVTVVGYEDNDAYPGGGAFLIRNTWGPKWQENGYARLSYNVFRHYVNDIVAFHIAGRGANVGMSPTTKETTNAPAGPVHKLTPAECVCEQPGLLHPDNVGRYRQGLWMNDNQVCFRAGQPGAEFRFTLTVPGDSDYALTMAGTRAPDYGVYTFLVDSRPVGRPIDFCAISVRPTGPVRVGVVHCRRGEATVTVRCTGKSFASLGYFLGLDWVALE